MHVSHTRKCRTLLSYSRGSQRGTRSQSGAGGSARKFPAGRRAHPLLVSVRVICSDRVSRMVSRMPRASSCASMWILLIAFSSLCHGNMIESTYRRRALAQLDQCSSGTACFSQLDLSSTPIHYSTTCGMTALGSLRCESGPLVLRSIAPTAAALNSNLYSSLPALPFALLPLAAICIWSVLVMLVLDAVGGSILSRCATLRLLRQIKGIQ
jgi:hypothetical protein